VKLSPFQNQGTLSVPLRLLATVLRPLDVRVLPQNAGFHEGADVHPHAVVEIGIPADGLLGQRLPADEDVMGLLAREDELQLLLQCLGGGETEVGSCLPSPCISVLGSDPVPEYEYVRFSRPLWLSLW